MDVEGELHNSPPHGQKRHPEDDLQSEQRLAKRFNLLNLGHDGKLLVPIQAPLARRTRSNAFSDTMHLDDSRDKIFIHDLDDEISDSETEEGKLIFLPDIEKKFTNIPKSLLSLQSPSPYGSELVLYSVPESLSVPKEQDIVRKAIMESRKRALVKHVQNTEEQPPVTGRVTNGIGIPPPTVEQTHVMPAKEEDAMDID